MDEAKGIFSEANIYFGGQIEKDFRDLINFNKYNKLGMAGLMREGLEDKRLALEEVDK